MSSFSRPTRSDLISRDRDDLTARVAGADSRLRRSNINALATMHGGAMDGAYGRLDWVADQIIPDSADSDHLARWASFWGVYPKAATATVDHASGTGVDDTPVPAGTVMARGDGFDYVTTADAVVAGGVIVCAIQATLAGAAGAADAGTLLTLASPIADISSDFVFVGDGTPGTDAESDDELLARLKQRVASAPRGGGPGDYIRWALSQSGVTRAWEFPLWEGLGTVGVAFVFDDRMDIFPLGGDVTAMQAFLDSVAPVTASVTAFAPANDAIAFTIHLDPDTPALRAAVTAELADLFTREGAPGGEIFRSHYDQAVGVAVGAGDYDVSVPAGNITPASTDLPTLGVITWV